MEAALRRALLLGLVLALGAAAPAEAARRPGPPVVLIVFDEFPTDSLAGVGDGIDPVRYPGFAALARTSTWFRNAASVSDTTSTSVPSILTSTHPQRHNRFKLTYRSYRHSIFTMLGRRGYRITPIDHDSRICPPPYCRSHGRFHPPRLSPVRTRVDEVHHVLRILGRTRPGRFVYFHSLLPHVPWHLTPSGHLRDPGPPGGDSRVLASPYGFSDPFLTIQDEQRHLLQVGYVDRVIRAVTRVLKRRRMFDRSLIVVTADHGVSFELGALNRRGVRRDGRNIEEIPLVPLFVKRPRQTRGRVSPAWVRGTDVVPTIADALGFRPGWRTVGRSAFSRRVRARRFLVTSSPDIGYTVSVRGTVVERRRRANIARRHLLFGTGSWEKAFHIGPHPELLGARPGDLATAPAGGLKARYDLPRSLRRVDRRALFLPTWAVGRLTGRDAGPGSRRDLALAVNGRIRAVGRSVHLSGKRQSRELFTLIFDERYLRSGRNTMELYEVRRSGPNLALAPLGGRS